MELLNYICKVYFRLSIILLSDIPRSVLLVVKGRELTTMHY